MVILLGIFFFLVTCLVIMVLESRKRRVEHEEGDEEVGYSGFDENPREEYLGEEEESEHDSAQKTKQDQIPLWKYVTRPGAGKGGGTTKFHCPHCNNNYTGSYTCARKHLCGKRPWDGDKQIGIKTCVGVSVAERAKYIREEEEAQYKYKKSKGFFEPSSQSHAERTPSASSHGNGYGGTGSPNISSRRRTISHIRFP